MSRLSKTRTAPTAYPRLLFHGVRSAQALASLVVAAIMFYFVWALQHEGYVAPKTFFTLLGASLLTLLLLVVTLIIYVRVGLSPQFNLCCNGLLLAMWTPGFIFLWYYSSPTLSHVCNRKTWIGPVGISICRTYKALFAFATLGTVTTIAAFALDIVTWRRSVARGKYQAANADGEAKPFGSKMPGFTDSRNSVALENYTTPNLQRDAASGYAVPEEQFSYDDADTAYHGGHEPEPASTLDTKK